MEMRAELQRCRAAQTAHATLLLAGHPEQRGLRKALADEMAEDLEICGMGGKPAIPWPGCGCWYCRGCPGWPNISGLWLTERPDSAHTEQDGAV